MRQHVLQLRNGLRQAAYVDEQDGWPLLRMPQTPFSLLWFMR